MVKYKIIGEAFPCYPQNTKESCIIDQKITWITQNEVDLLFWFPNKGFETSITYPLLTSYHHDLILQKSGLTGIKIRSPKVDDPKQECIISSVKGSIEKEIISVTTNGVEVIDTDLLLDSLLFSSDTLDCISNDIILGKERISVYDTILSNFQKNKYIPEIINKNDIPYYKTSNLTNSSVQRVLNLILESIEGDIGYEIRLTMDMEGENCRFYNSNGILKSINSDIFHLLISLATIIQYLILGYIVIWKENGFNFHLFRYIKDKNQVKKIMDILEKEVLRHPYPQLIIYPGDDSLIPSRVSKGLKYIKIPSLE